MDDPRDILLVVTLAASALACILPLYVRRGLRIVFQKKIFRSVPRPAAAQQPGVSVIVAARNEERALPHCLKSLLRQEYPGEMMEILVVDDRSTDGTREILDRYAAADTRIRAIRIETLPAGASGKKNALAHGIAAASHDTLLFTDADCRPAPGWVRGMQEKFMEGCGIVLGFSPVAKAPGATNGLNRLETYRTAAMMFGFSGNGRPYMSVGRSWGYRRRIYEAANGMTGIMDMPGGDDDLLLQKMTSLPGVTVAACVDPESIVSTEIDETLPSYFRRKMRHFSTSARYPLGLQLTFGVSQFIGLLSLAGGILCGALIHPACLLLPAAHLQIHRSNLRACMLDQANPSIADRLFAGFMEPVYLLLYSLLGVAGLLFRPSWKG